jgi:hypothetical protein
MRRAALVFLLVAVPASAQDYDGYVSSMVLGMPGVNTAEGSDTVAEWRTRLFTEGLFNASDGLHMRVGVYVDALVADRGALGATETVKTATVQPADIYADYRGSFFDVRAGMSRIVWGRLDEFQPTDVVNPLDLSKFLLEGRSEARLPVALVRGRLFLPASSALEAIVVPFFRSARFDQLDEATSPFFLAPRGDRERHAPGTSWKNVQGGARFTSTLGRVDFGLSAWRGFEAFPTYELQPFPIDPLILVFPTYDEVFPRYTMLGGDFETVSGPWGLRGEFAWFHDSPTRSFEGGIGADRRAGDYRVALNAVVTHASDTNVTLVGWAERTFVRETRTARLLAVYDPTNDTAFVRGIGAVSLQDNVWLEGSIGWLNGEAPRARPQGATVLGLLSDRDFAYVRLRFHF